MFEAKVFKRGSILDVIQQLFIAEYIKEWIYQRGEDGVSRKSFSFLEVNPAPLGLSYSPLYWGKGLGLLLSCDKKVLNKIPLFDTEDKLGSVDSVAVPNWMVVLKQLNARKIRPSIRLSSQAACMDAIKDSIQQAASSIVPRSRKATIKLYKSAADSEGYQSYMEDSIFDLVVFNLLVGTGKKIQEAKNALASKQLEHMSKKLVSPFVLAYPVYGFQKHAGLQVASTQEKLVFHYHTLQPRWGVVEKVELYIGGIPLDSLYAIQDSMNEYLAEIGTVSLYSPQEYHLYTVKEEARPLVLQ